MRTQLSRFVEPDLEIIADYIAQDNPSRAVTFIRELRDKFREIGEGPLHYQLRPEIGEDARIAVVGQYVILFRITDRVVRIERVVFGGRNLPSFFR
ncbi:MAG TPA: type II toxin-antitoxin system RelE/ParE family toxin [Terracidiphilus sp.]|jgi:plasmid stabilization system protein ParE|nr:type II toxin-antitoxin system RelE/ParE family toxin [Terracidiphilus sp.]